MIEEIHIFGIYFPAGLAWAVLSLVITSLLRGPLLRLPLRVVLWQPALVELAMFLLIWWGIARIADLYLPRGMVS
ncbi:protein AaeX (plasmid) [Pararobbsia alpina]|uniref:DUF1656 domain-containing protein n=1 Tax=Pararobbsia alpina TaxID=621374 RepID=UPI0039A40C91